MGGALKSFLISRSGTRLCGFPLEHVIENMRALPVEIFFDTPQFMIGISVIRGAMVPVVDMAKLTGGGVDSKASRYVTVRLKHRQVAFAVDSVIGIRQFSVDSFEDFPRLLSEAGHSFVTAIATLDADLCVILDAARVIPESAWLELDAIDAMERGA